MNSLSQQYSQCLNSLSFESSSHTLQSDSSNKIKGIPQGTDSLKQNYQDNTVNGETEANKNKLIKNLYLAKCKDVGIKQQENYNAFLKSFRFRTQNNKLLFDNWFIGNNAIQAVSDIIKNVTESSKCDDIIQLDVSKNQNIKLNGIISLSNAIQSSPSISIINTSKMNMNSQMTQQFLSIILPKQYLFYLNLSRNALGNKSCEVIQDRLKGCQCLQILDLSDCRIDFNSFQCVLNGLMECKSLISINLSRNQLNNNNILAISNWLEKDTTILQQLTLIGCNHLNAINNIHKLITISKYSQLARLNISENKINTQQFIQILQQLHYNHSIKTLNISYNNISDPIDRRFCDFLSHNKSLEKINLSNCKLQSSFLSQIHQGLMCNTTLRYLVLSNNRMIGNNGLFYLSLHGVYNVVSLNLNKCGISSGKMISQMLEQSQLLQELNINNNTITDTDALLIYQSLLLCSHSIISFTSKNNLFSFQIQQQIEDLMQEKKYNTIQESKKRQSLELVNLQQQVKEYYSSRNIQQEESILAEQSFNHKEVLRIQKIVSLLEKELNDVQSIEFKKMQYQKQSDKLDQFYQNIQNVFHSQESQLNQQILEATVKTKSSMNDLTSLKQILAEEERKKEIEKLLKLKQNELAFEIVFAESKMKDREFTQIACEILIKNIIQYNSEYQQEIPLISPQEVEGLMNQQQRYKEERNSQQEVSKGCLGVLQFIKQIKSVRENSKNQEKTEVSLNNESLNKDFENELQQQRTSQISQDEINQIRDSTCQILKQQQESERSKQSQKDQNPSELLSKQLKNSQKKKNIQQKTRKK